MNYSRKNITKPCVLCKQRMNLPLGLYFQAALNNSNISDSGVLVSTLALHQKRRCFRVGDYKSSPGVIGRPWCSGKGVNS